MLNERKILQEYYEHDTEFMLSPVPETARRSTWKQIMVWIGFGYVVTGLFVGGVLAGTGGKDGIPPGMATLAIFIGMGLLMVLTVLLGIMAQKTGLSLALISRYSYGMKGTNLPLIIMALLTLGWFASITGMVGQIWSSFVGNPTDIIIFNPASLGYETVPSITLEIFLACLIFGFVFTYTAYKGIEAIEKVAIPVAPVILIIALFVGIGMLNEGGGFSAFMNEARSIEGLALGNAITIVMGSWIAGVIMGIDLFRFNKSVGAVIACAVACFILTNPLLNFVGYIGAVSVGQYNYMEWLVDKGLLFGIIGLIAWTTSLWTTNNAELYCNSLYLGPVISSYSKKPVNRGKLVVIVGALGTLLGSLGFYQMFFEAFITILGAAFLPLAGPLIADYFISKKRNYDLNQLNSQPAYRMSGIVSFLTGAIVGLIFEYAIPAPFGLPSGLIGLCVSLIIYPIMYNLTKDKSFDQQSVGGNLNEKSVVK